MCSILPYISIHSFEYVSFVFCASKSVYVYRMKHFIRRSLLSSLCMARKRKAMKAIIVCATSV